MTSEVQICNVAVGHIGVKGIISLEENHETARKCKLIYPVARDAALRDGYWNFATSFAKLVRLSDSMPGYSFMYSKPLNCAKVRKVFSEASLHRPNQNDFRVIQAPVLAVPAIVTNVEYAWAEFTYLTKDTNVFDAKFIEYLTYKMAAMLAIPLTGNPALAQSMAAMASNILVDTRFTNATEGHTSIKHCSPLIESRS